MCMIGEKMSIMFWDMPVDNNHWVIEVEGTGSVALRYYDKVTKISGRLEFTPDTDVEVIKSVLRSLGFTENPRGVAVR